MSSLFAHPEGIVGRYRTDAGEWAVTLRACGEGLEIAALAETGDAQEVITDDSSAISASFSAPRAAADRYPDWAAFEWQNRLENLRPFRASVWRIAENDDRVFYIGMAVHSAETRVCIPLAASLWRGWAARRPEHKRALFWHTGKYAHLWLARPFAAPHHIRIGPDPSPDDVVCAVAAVDNPADVILEVGGLSLDFWRELTRAFPGRTRQVEPFTEILMPPSVREQVLAAPDPTVYLPAIGAARAFAEGAPPILRLCASSPEHMAAVG
jgi:hypothetical protein